MVWPHLADLERSGIYVEPVLAHARVQGATTVDVRELVSGLPVRERVISTHDAHPRARVHVMVAKVLR